MAEQKKTEGKSRIEIIEDSILELMAKVEALEKAFGEVKKAIPKKGLFGGKREKKAILDTQTKVIYPSKAAVGKKLAEEADTDALDHFAWYKLLNKFPDRFEELAPDDPRAVKAWKEQEDELAKQVEESNKKLAEEAKADKK